MDDERERAVWLRSAGVPPRLLRLLLMAERHVLFVCVGNAGRSLMAEALFNAEAPPGWRALSAGTRPAAAPNPRTAPLLREIGVELPGHPPQALTEEMMRSATLAVTMGCLDDASCPAHLRDAHPRDWALPDPARLDEAGFRSVRDELRRRIGALIEEIRTLDRA